MNHNIDPPNKKLLETATIISFTMISILFLTYSASLIFDNMGQLKKFIGLLLLLLGCWLTLSKNPLYLERNGTVTNLLTTIIGLTSLSIGLYSILPHILLLIKTDADGNSLLSAGALVLTVTTAYFLWALVRTEEQAKYLINDLQKKQHRISDIEKTIEFNRSTSENLFYSNLYTLNYLFRINITAIQNTNHQLLLLLKDSDVLIRENKKLKELNDITDFISKVTISDKNQIIENADLLSKLYSRNIRLYKDGDNQYIEWFAICPVLEAIVKHLNYLFISENRKYCTEEQLTTLRKLILVMCSDLGIEPNNLDL